MDLASISMKDLADRLGVGVATLYRYVSDRTELVRLASARAAHRTFPRDTGQPWPELLTGYAESIYSALSVSPMLLHAYVDGHIGPELEIEFADSFLAAMKKRGFDPRTAMEIFQVMGVIAVGSAVATAHATAARNRAGPFGKTLKKLLATREADELPALRDAVDHYICVAGDPDWSKAVRRLIESVAAERSETPA
jgi:AcrR family transcriptional regulator